MAAEKPYYKSKDEDFMQKLKRSVYDGMRDMEPEDKKRAWKMMQRKVFLDDIHQIAIGKLEAKEPVYMGTGNYVPELAVITAKSLEFSKEARELVESIVKASKLSDVYYTGKYKTSRILKSHLEDHAEILDMEIKAIKPAAILAFGPVFPEGTTEHLGIPVVQTHGLTTLLTSEDDEEKKKLKAEIWNDVKQIKKILQP